MSVYTSINGELDIYYEGCVLGLYEKNTIHGIIYIAKVWDKDNSCVKDFLYKKQGCNYFAKANVDADIIIARKVYNYYKKQAQKTIGLFIQAEKKAIKKGRAVVVYKGNKIKKGTKGIVANVKNIFNLYTNEFEDYVELFYNNHYMYIPKSYVKTIDDDSVIVKSKIRKKAIQQIAYNQCPAYVQLLLDNKKYYKSM